MARPRYKPVAPDQVIRELRKEFRRLETKEEPGPERAAMLAAFTRAAHAERQLNMAMHMAALCLEEDPDAPDMLIAAYITAGLDDPEERLRAFIDLRDLGRYLEHQGLRDFTEQQIQDETRHWVKTATDQERKHRLRTVGAMFGRDFADAIRDEIQFL